MVRFDYQSLEISFFSLFSVGLHSHQIYLGDKLILVLFPIKTIMDYPTHNWLEFNLSFQRRRYQADINLYLTRRWSWTKTTFIVRTLNQHRLNRHLADTGMNNFFSQNRPFKGHSMTCTPSSKKATRMRGGHIFSKYSKNNLAKLQY